VERDGGRCVLVALFVGIARLQRIDASVLAEGCSVVGIITEGDLHMYREPQLKGD
jgi:hypothetical protein